jgi:hypothetical protein
VRYHREEIIKDEIKPSSSLSVVDPLGNVWSLSYNRKDKNNKDINIFG